MIKEGKVVSNVKWDNILNKQGYDAEQNGVEYIPLCINNLYIYQIILSGEGACQDVINNSDLLPFAY